MAKEIVLNLIFLVQVLGHGMLLEPPQRSSLWRFNLSAPENFDDNQLFCGGKTVQWEEFQGKCGVCGDRFDDPHPQDNENTGLYGQGNIVRTYSRGTLIETFVNLTQNHLGTFEYSLCVLEDPSKPEPEECFQKLNLTSGNFQFQVESSQNLINNTIELPEDVTCEHCVLRWWYTTGNNWGDCGNGTFSEGCGPQETFINCADISIL